MDVKQYFKEVQEYLDNLSEEEMDQLLIEAGIEKCPYEEESEVFNISISASSGVYEKSNMYVSSNSYNYFSNILVA